MDIGTAIATSVGIVTVGGALLAILKPSKSSNGKEDRYVGSKAETEIGKLWDEKQSKEMCLEITTGIKSDITEIKESQKATIKGITDIQQTLINWRS